MELHQLQNFYEKKLRKIKKEFSIKEFALDVRS